MPMKPNHSGAKKPPTHRTRRIGRPKEKRGVGKEVLIERTKELIRKLPPEKLSLTAAAANAGVHLTLLKYYFHDRARLLVDVAWSLNLDLNDRILAGEGQQAKASDRLHVRIDAIIDFYLLNPFYHRLMLEIMTAEENASSEELIKVWMSKTLTIYRQIFSDGVADGTLRAVDELYIYLAILGLCEQFHHSVRLSNRISGSQGNISNQTVDRYKEFLHEFIFHGVSPKAPD